MAVAGQLTHVDQEHIAHALDLPAERVRVVYPAIGGAFGGREDMSLQIVLALASWRLADRGERRPIRCQWSREESMVGHHKRHFDDPVGLGVKPDGRVVVAEATGHSTPAPTTTRPTRCSGTSTCACRAHMRIPHLAVDSFAVLTNAVPGGAFRGFGAPRSARSWPRPR